MRFLAFVFAIAAIVVGLYGAVYALSSTSCQSTLTCRAVQHLEIPYVPHVPKL
jgi:hypothetical protein